MKENTLIFLMDYDGHPTLSDEFAERYRTYALQDVINDSYLDRNKCVIVSTALEPEGYKRCQDLDTDPSQTTRSRALKNQATLDKGWTWIEITKTDSFAHLEHLLQKIDFDLAPEKTNIIYGGTNTSGCVLHSSNFSLNKFCDHGYDCQLYLPFCDDSQIAGITTYDRSQKAFAIVYEYLKRNNLINNVDILTRFADLKLVRSNKRFDYKST